MTDAPRQMNSRNPIGWILLAAILLLLLLTNLAIYLIRPADFASNLKRADAQLKTVMRLKTQTRDIAGETNSLLDSSIESLVPFENKETEARLALLVFKHVAGRQISEDELKPLKAENDPRVKAYYEIYSSKDLPRKAAQKLAVDVGSKHYYDQVAAFHALVESGDPSALNQLDHGGSLTKSSTLIVLSGAIFFLGGILLLIFLILIATRQIVPKGLPTELLPPSDADRLALRDAHYFLLFLLLPFLVRWLPLSHALGTSLEILVYVLLFGAIVALSRVPVEGRLFTLQRLGINKVNLGRNIALGSVVAVANIPLVLLLGALGTYVFRNLPQAEHPLVPQLISGDIWVVVRAFLSASIAAPFIEEIMFRGTMFPAISSVLKSPVAGAVISSAFFAAIHPTGIPAWPALAALGAVSCTLAYYTKSLVPSIAFHATHNSLTLLYTLLIFRS